MFTNAEFLVLKKALIPTEFKIKLLFANSL